MNKNLEKDLTSLEEDLVLGDLKLQEEYRELQMKRITHLVNIIRSLQGFINEKNLIEEYDKWCEKDL